MSVENLLSRLEKVKSSGPNKWIARCPAHEDKSPSLSIKDDAGKVLIKCFAGCDVGDILGAVGLEFAELFPPNDGSWKPEETGRIGFSKFTALDALRCLNYEGAVLAICAADMAEGKVLTEKERQRLEVSCGRIAAALSYLDVN